MPISGRRNKRPVTIAAALDANHEVALRAILLETASEDTFAWRSAIGTNLMQEAARRGYSLVVKYLLGIGTAEQLEEKADAQGNYSTHLAAKDGHLRTCVILAKGLPGALHLQTNNLGAYTLSLALANVSQISYILARVPILEELLALFASDVMTCALARCQVAGASPWEHLLAARDPRYLCIVLKKIREREEWKDILCMPDSKGKTVAHYVVPQESRSWHCTDTEFYGGRNLRLPTFAEVLALIPTEAFTMEDNNGLRPWQYFTDHCTFSQNSIHRLERILAHTPIEEMFSTEETPEAKLEMARLAFSAAIANYHHPHFCELLRAILTRLPLGTADGGVEGEEPAFFSLVRRQPLLTSASVVFEFLTEEGCLAVTARGETFVHLAVRAAAGARGHGFQTLPCDSLLHALSTIIYEKVDCRRLLSVRCEQGITAADVAEEVGRPRLAQQLRPTVVKSAAA